jgi:UDP-N-acetylmuramyl pentapeptide phosphotransferase/UDP-N-acetylglucosamine-1-phosphate transferase
LALGISWTLTFACIKLMPLCGLMDVPNGRHAHAKPTPTGGGIAIAIAFFAVWGLLLLSPWNYFIGVMRTPLLLRLMILSLCLLGFGLADDRFKLRARYKLLFQVLLAVSCWYCGIRLNNIFTIELNEAFSLAVTICWIVGFINAFNLIDGMDGVAAGLAAMASLCMASVLALQHAPLDMVIVLSLGAACLGFLRYNFHPARIFLGDSGSMFIGFMFAIIGITATSRAASFSSVLIPVLAAGVPFFDVVLAIWRRYTAGVLMKLRLPSSRQPAPGIMDADTEHLHHRILARHGNHRKSTLILYGLAVVFAAVAILMQLGGETQTGLALILLIMIAVTVVRRLASVEMWNSTMVMVEGLRRPKRGVLIAVMHPFYDLAVLLVLFLLTSFLFSDQSLPVIIKTHYAELIYCVFPIAAILHLSGIYRRYWVRASSRDYLYLVELMLAGNVIAAIVRSNLHPPTDLRLFLAFHAFFFLAASAIILAERVGIRVIKNSVIRRDLYLRRFGLKNLPKVLVYGGGQRAYFYLHNGHRNIETNPVHVVGIMDDHPVLQGHHVHGYKILGGMKMLARIYAEHRFDRVVVTCEIDDLEKKQDLLDFCRSHGVEVSEFLFHEVAVTDESIASAKQEKNLLPTASSVIGTEDEDENDSDPWQPTVNAKEPIIHA